MERKTSPKTRKTTIKSRSKKLQNQNEKPKMKNLAETSRVEKLHEDLYTKFTEWWYLLAEGTHSLIVKDGGKSFDLKPIYAVNGTYQQQYKSFAKPKEVTAMVWSGRSTGFDQYAEKQTEEFDVNKIFKKMRMRKGGGMFHFTSLPTV